MRKMIPSRLRAWCRRQWAEWRALVYVFVFVFVPARSVLADWNWVPSGSMNPTILEGDLVFVNKAAYDLRIPLTLQRLGRWADPARGDIVVLFSPADEIRLVKRVIGLPGDTLEMRNNVLFLNGQRVDYAPLPDTATRDMGSALKQRAVFAREELPGKSHSVMGLPQIPAARNIPRTLIPAGHYFVMGDNRDNSKDSRFFSFVGRDRIVGRAQGVIVSFNKLDHYQPRWGRFCSTLQ